jgi:hypothetical protein
MEWTRAEDSSGLGMVSLPVTGPPEESLREFPSGFTGNRVSVLRDISNPARGVIGPLPCLRYRDAIDG